ncbi:hypothetical protein [Streptomyces sp. AGS-58]|uniref:hypothetical protein n=1 Tax=unclassified Streptomyces TaxID=2593676 RepID=UPI0035A3686F
MGDTVRALVMPDLRPYADVKAAVTLARRGLTATRRPAAAAGRRMLRALRRPVRRTLAVLGAAVRLILSGSRTLLHLLVGWLTGTYGANGSVLARSGGAAVVLLGIAHTIAEYRTPAVIGVAWLWCQGAIMATRGWGDRVLGKASGEATNAAREALPAGPRKKLLGWLRKTPPPGPAETPAETPVETPVEPPLTALIRELIGNDNGVHLSVLRPAMKERLPGLAEADDKQLRQVLITAGWDPSRTFRAGGVAGRAGIHRDQLPPLPLPGSGQGAAPASSPPLKSGSDLRKSPVVESVESRAESGRKAPRKLPDGWTEEDEARGYRWVQRPDGGESSWVIERREGVG